MIINQSKSSHVHKQSSQPFEKNLVPRKVLKLPELKDLEIPIEMA